MLEIWNRDIQKVLELLRYAEEFDDFLCLCAEVSIDGECLLGVDVGHFEIMFCQWRLYIGRGERWEE